MMKLNKIPAIHKKRKVVGRGGKLGGTSGKGNKGQKARTGGMTKTGFEGGQMPLYRRLPKRGFNNARFETSYEIINLSQLEHLFDQGTEITKDLMVEKRLVKKPKAKKGHQGFLVKVLGNGTLTKSLIVYADAFSEAAKNALEAHGGKANIVVQPTK
jgi:large subunit ribosomal protein L15